MSLQELIDKKNAALSIYEIADNQLVQDFAYVDYLACQKKIDILLKVDKHEEENIVPKDVRNFWIKGEVDGHKTISGGPQNKAGGLSVDLYQRSAGSVSFVAHVDCMCNGDKLVTVISSPDNSFESTVIETKR